MSRIPYTYCVIKYVHDPGAGETLNVGVVLHAPKRDFLAARFEQHYERLSNTFAGFNGEFYKRTLRQLEGALDRLELSPTLSLFPSSDEGDVSRAVKMLIPDVGLNFQSGPVLAGITEDPDQTLNHIFDRMVTSQYPKSHAERRSDDEVWTVYNRSLSLRRIHNKLTTWTASTEDVKLKFDHAFKNEQWHVLQPASMDYKNAESIQKKATQLLGTGMALSGHRELGTMYILLGKPELESHQAAYRKAKNLLHKLPIKHELIEEDEADQFAENLADYMSRHGILVEPT